MSEKSLFNSILIIDLLINDMDSLSLIKQLKQKKQRIIYHGNNE